MLLILSRLLKDALAGTFRSFLAGNVRSESSFKHISFALSNELLLLLRAFR